MSEANEKQAGFFGTYFDRDSILRISRWAEILAWVTLTVYLLNWIVSMLLFFAQYYNGMFFEKGMTFLNALNFFSVAAELHLKGDLRKSWQVVGEPTFLIGLPKKSGVSESRA